VSRTVWRGSVRGLPSHATATRDYRLRGFAIGGSTSHNHVPVINAVELMGIGHAGDLGRNRTGSLELRGKQGVDVPEGFLGCWSAASGTQSIGVELGRQRTRQSI
jgi:hypothetical protein